MCWCCFLFRTWINVTIVIFSHWFWLYDKHEFCFNGKDSLLNCSFPGFCKIFVFVKECFLQQLKIKYMCFFIDKFYWPSRRCINNSFGCLSVDFCVFLITPVFSHSYLCIHFSTSVFLESLYLWKPNLVDR